MARTTLPPAELPRGCQGAKPSRWPGEGEVFLECGLREAARHDFREIERAEGQRGLGQGGAPGTMGGGALTSATGCRGLRRESEWSCGLGQ